MTQYTIKTLFKSNKSEMVVILKVGKQFHIQEEDSYIYHNLLGLHYDTENTLLFPVTFNTEQYNAFIAKLRENEVEYQVIENGEAVDYSFASDILSTDVYRRYALSITPLEAN